MQGIRWGIENKDQSAFGDYEAAGEGICNNFGKKALHGPFSKIVIRFKSPAAACRHQGSAGAQHLFGQKVDVLYGSSSMSQDGITISHPSTHFRGAMYVSIITAQII